MNKASYLLVIFLLLIKAALSQPFNKETITKSYPTDIDVYKSVIMYDYFTGIETGDRKDLPNWSTRRKLNGKVKSLKVRDYYGKMEFGKFQIKGIKLFSLFKFDENNLLVEIDDFNSDSCMINNSSFKYDDKGNHIETINNLYIPQNSEGIHERPTSKTVNIYDEKNKLVESNSYNLDGSLCFKSINIYDKFGKHIEKNDYSSDGKLMSKSIFSYDAKGHHNLTNIYDDLSHFNHLIIKNICKYDLNGNLVERTDSSWDITVRTFYKYNSKGDLIQENEWWPGAAKAEKVYNYEYDRIGNWIKKYKFVNGEQTAYKERQIEYY